MLENGYVLLHRKIQNWEWFSHPATRDVFIYLFLTANYEDGRFMGVDIKRGQKVTSISNLSKVLGFSERQIRTAINHLKTTGELTSKRHPKFSLFTVLNYEEYQQATGKTTSERQANDSQATTKEESNKAIKQKEYIYMPDFEKFWKAYPKKVGKQNAIKIFQKIDPMSEELFEKIIAEVEWQKKFGSMQDKQYCKDPERWLRDKRWDDERIERNTFQNGNSSQQPKGEEDKRQWLFPPKQA